MKDGQLQRIVDSVAEVTRNGVGAMSSEELDTGWQRLESALESGKYPSVPIVISPRRWWLRGFAFATAALVLGFAAYRLVPPFRSASPLHYVLEGGTLGPGETIKAAPEVPAKLVFSDTSQVRLAPRAKLSVLSLDARGSRIALADGELDVQVQHRPGSSWRFEAGPFTVKVKGTAFHLAYESDRGRLALQMVTGVVEVRGPSDDRVLTLRAGESLELFAGPTAKPATVPQAPALTPKPVEVSPSPESAAPHVSTLSPRRRAPQPDRAEATPTSPDAHAWDRLIAQGDFSSVVQDAERRGLDATLASASAAELTALADAARYTKHNDLARQSLLSLRARFSGTARASDAAFFLGRLAELPPSASGTAVAWYETYLRESAQGPYASEALGREIALLARTDRTRARQAAHRYLEWFPHGTQAELAKSLVQSVPE
jgi:hypothetical protein